MEVSQLHHRNFQLGRKNAELEALVTKDSHNSSRPPSTDPPWAKRTKSLRRPSGRRAGGQAGHQGSTLQLAAHPATGVPILLNTSFNVMGEPIVETPEDAIACFLKSSLDCCIFEDRIVV